MEEELRERYDRQVRLWGGETQRRLQSAEVLLHSCDGLGSEIAKNLVLAGIGRFSIHEDRDERCKTDEGVLISEVDLVGNHFARVEHVGEAPRGAVCAEGLRRLNPFVNVAVLESGKEGFVEHLRKAHQQDDTIVVVLNNLTRAGVGSILCFLKNLVDEKRKNKEEGDESKARYIVVNHQLAHLALSFILPWTDCVKEYAELLSCHNLATKPRAFQLVAMLLEFWDSFPPEKVEIDFGKALLQLTTIRTENNLASVSDEDVEWALNFLTGKDDKKSSSAAMTVASSIDCSVVGGVVGQQIIRAVGNSFKATTGNIINGNDKRSSLSQEGKKHSNNANEQQQQQQQPREELYKWLAFDSSTEMSCVVGGGGCE